MSPAPVLLHHLLDLNGAAPDRVAVIDGERQCDYGMFRDRVADYAAAFIAAGVERGDRVAVLLPKSLEECWAIFGASRADAVVVPVNPLLKAPQIRHIVADAEARVLLTSQELLTVAEEATAGIDNLVILIAAEIGPRSSDAPAPRNIGEDLAAILYTSGSTGRPKGVMLSHRNLVAGTRIVRTYLGITASDRILSVLPFSFDYGLNQLLTAIEQAALTVLLTFRLGDEIVRAIARHEITGLAGVPTIWAILTRATPSMTKTALPSLRYITNSGGAVPTPTVTRLRQLLPTTRIFLMYGLTEAFRSTFLSPDELDRRPNSIGKAIPESEVFAVTEDGRRTRPGEPGILVHRGPTVSLGYWRRPEETAKVLRPNPLRPAELGGETVCYSGDLVVEDEDGFLSFVGRRDAMIKSSGYRISPTEVEECAMATGQFRQVAVIGLPDPVAGQRVHAVAVPLDGGTDTAQILAKMAGQLPAYMVPRGIDLVGSLPVTPNGKVDYRALVEERTRLEDRAA
jgi:acyl-CoA ligase (AMP-forming) (exosortase A-associated)